MPSYQTLKNSIKKLETRQKETTPQDGCGVIYQEDYARLPTTSNCKGGRKNKIGYLVVPRPMTLSEWQAEYSH